MVAYWKLTTHANMSNGTKLDEAKQKQNDRVCTHTHTSMPSFLTVHGHLLEHILAHGQDSIVVGLDRIVLELNNTLSVTDKKRTGSK